MITAIVLVTCDVSRIPEVATEIAAIEPVADKKLARFRVRLDAPDGVVTINLALGTRMAPPLALGERGGGEEIHGRASAIAMRPAAAKELMCGPRRSRAAPRA